MLLLILNNIFPFLTTEIRIHPSCFLYIYIISYSDEKWKNILFGKTTRFKANYILFFYIPHKHHPVNSINEIFILEYFHLHETLHKQHKIFFYVFQLHYQAECSIITENGYEAIPHKTCKAVFVPLCLRYVPFNFYVRCSIWQAM